ncbi:MAG: hypothetical protein ACRDON_06780 [Gaiellaceae bacterium]
MDAASFQRLEGRGAPRLLAHFEAIARVTAAEGGSARARLEYELGYELTERLVCALASRPRPRATACC